MVTHLIYIYSLCVYVSACIAYRELQERLRSLVGGALTRMAQEQHYKGRIADLEAQLQAHRVCLQCCRAV